MVPGYEVLAGRARFVDGETVAVGDRRFRARGYVIATGSVPCIPSIPGIDGVPVMTSDDVMLLDSPPASMDGAGNNYKKVIRSRNGVQITLDDTDGQETLLIETPGGQKLTLKDGAASVELVDSNGNSVKLEAAGITLQASAKVKISAGTIEMSAGMLTVDAGMSKFSGVVKSDTVITNAVVSSSYTPGAGNIW